MKSEVLYKFDGADDQLKDCSGNGRDLVEKETSTYWLSSQKMTIMVSVDDKGVIIESPPIVRRFIGQPFTNLVNWMSRQLNFAWVKL